MGINLNKYIVNKAQKSEVAHSSAHARIAHGDNFGSTSNANDSFEKRLLKERQANRIVKSYKTSDIFNIPSTARSELRLELYQPRGSINSAADMAKRTTRQNLDIKPFIPYRKPIKLSSNKFGPQV